MENNAETVTNAKTPDRTSSNTSNLVKAFLLEEEEETSLLQDVGDLRMRALWDLVGFQL